MYLKSFIHLVQMIQVKELDEVAQQVERIASAARCIIAQTFVPEEDKVSVINLSTVFIMLHQCFANQFC